MTDDARTARGVAARLSIAALLWTYAAVKLGWNGWPWILSAGGGTSALAVSLALVLGAAQGFFIARRSGARIVKWSREAATARATGGSTAVPIGSRDALLVLRAFVVIGVFATFGLTLKHYLLAKHPVIVGSVYVLASTSLIIAALGLVRLAWLEGSAQT